MPGTIYLALVAEDELSMAVLERAVASSSRDFVVLRRMTERGVDKIRCSIGKYRQASRVLPHVVLADLDRADCPLALRASWGIGGLPDSMLFRVAVRETESWLLGDRDGFSEFTSISRATIPRFPEQESDPKRTLVGLVRRSRNRKMIAELVPPQGSPVPVGPLYNRTLVPFVRDKWNIAAAAEACPSLRNLLERLATFMAGD